MTAPIGIIGGSGLAELGIIQNTREVEVDTPFGKPSSSYLLGDIAGRKVVFLARHGKNHTFTPTDVPYRANIYGMKKLGVKQLVSLCAVGSLKEEIRPLDIVFPDQYYDHTRHRKSSFFHKDVVAHVALPDPFCSDMSAHFSKYLEKKGIRYHNKGTYINMEGPQFSTRAESRVYQLWGMDIIGMTGATEAKLAREAGICLTIIATITDYDAWRVTEEAVDTSMVLENLKQGKIMIADIIRNAIPDVPVCEGCICQSGIQHAIITALPEGTEIDFFKLLE